MNGTSTESFLGLSEEQRRAIVGTTSEDSLATVPSVCSGFAVGPTAVLTSTHCWEGGRVFVHVAGEAAILSDRVALYPESDLLFVELDPAKFQFQEFFAVPGDEPAIGQRVLAAGYGVDEEGDSGALRFIVEEVSSVDSAHVVITQHGRGGLCNGDSGAPLLARRSDGAVAALGLLLGGSRNCRGTDVFLRTSALLPWLQQQTILTTAPASCGTLTTTGRCFGKTALWCDSSRLHRDECSEEAPCGYDTTVQGYRCVRPGLDPCGGADEFGRCDGTTALTCGGGELTRVVCMCGAACGYDNSGKAGCF